MARTLKSIGKALGNILGEGYSLTDDVIKETSTKFNLTKVAKNEYDDAIQKAANSLKQDTFFASTALEKQNISEAATVGRKTKTEYLVEQGRRAKESNLRKIANNPDYNEFDDLTEDVLKDKKNVVSPAGTYAEQYQQLDKYELDELYGSVELDKTNKVSAPGSYATEYKLNHRPESLDQATTVGTYQYAYRQKTGAIKEMRANGTITRAKAKQQYAAARKERDIARNKQRLNDTMNEFNYEDKERAKLFQEEFDELYNKNTPWSTTARAALGTAVVGAGICAALSSSRGQQNNAQLYGQQPLY